MQNKEKRVKQCYELVRKAMVLSCLVDVEKRLVV